MGSIAQLGLSIALTTFLTVLQAAELPNSWPDLDKRESKISISADRQTAVRRLQQAVPGARVDFDPVLGQPRFVGSPQHFLSKEDGRGGAVTAATAATINPRAQDRALRGFLEEHRALYGFGAEGLAAARRRVTTSRNGVRTLFWQQRMNDIDVFESVLLAHTTAKDELLNVSSAFLPAVAAGKEPKIPGPRQPRLTPGEAVGHAATAIGERIGDVQPEGAPVGPEQRQRLRAPGLNGSVEVRLVWLPMSGDEVRLSWVVRLTSRARGETSLVLVDASTGELLIRRRLTVDLTEAAYRVFTSDSPSPQSPGLATPSMAQPPVVPRSLVTLAALDTNASPAGWLADDGTETRGNNVQAHLDRNADDQPDLPRPQGAGRIFDFPLDLTQPPATYGNASVVQLFYWGNWMHDRLYQLGFDEAAGNFQFDNFNRGGSSGDPMIIDAQDGSGFNNANYTPAEDGRPGRIQMYLFSGPEPDRDGGLDTEIFLHEYTHGLTDRLVGGGVGISALQTAGMGEGWSDFYALALLSESSDDLDGNYAAGSYATHQFFGLQENYYFGIRRYPYSTDMSRNPLTLRDIDPTQANAHEGVPLSPLNSPFSPLSASEVHNQGEVWCVTLWEVRARLIRKHGFEVGNQLVLQLVTDGLRLSPPNPTFLQARDAIIQADLVNQAGANFRELWGGFAKRGMGASAMVPANSTTIGVVEAFDEPDDLVILPVPNLTASGPLEGPFSPSSFTLIVTNLGTNSISWSLINTSAWLQVAPTSGQLLPHGPSTSINVQIDSAARILPAGIYLSNLVFTNHSTGVTQTRTITLSVGQPASWTESFDQRDNDLANTMLTFTPNGSVNFYDVCRQSVSYFQVDPEGGNPLVLGDDQALSVTLSGTNQVGLYGQRTNTFFVGSNGYLTFDRPDANYLVSLPAHFSQHRLSMLFNDYSPNISGRVIWKQLNDRVTVTFIDVPEFATANKNSFQTELFYDGTIRVTWLNLDAADGLVGLSAGQGVPTGFQETDFSAAEICGRLVSLTIPTPLTEAAGTVLARIDGMEPAPPNFFWQAQSSDPSLIVVPNTIPVAAGATGVGFPLQTIDDSLLNGVRSAQVELSAPGYRLLRRTVNVLDTEATFLTLNFPDNVSEGDGSVQGTLTLGQAPQSDVFVRLTTDVESELVPPPVALVRSGQTEVSIDLTIVDDQRFDGNQSVTLTAAVAGWGSGQAVLTILDNEQPNLELVLPSSIHEGAGVLTAAGILRLPGTLSTNLLVSLSSADATEARVALTVTVPAGAKEAAFNILAIDDEEVDGDQTSLVTATTPGWSPAMATLLIRDNDLPPLPSNPRPAHLAIGVDTLPTLSWSSSEGEQLENGGFETGDLQGWQTAQVGSGRFVVQDGTFDPVGPEGPAASLVGRFSAVTEQSGPGRSTLYQDVTLPAGAGRTTLRWSDRIRNHADRFASNQSFRVEIRQTNDLLRAVAFTTTPGQPLLNGWNNRSYDLSSFAGQTVRVAFVQEDALYYFNVFLDAISLETERTGVSSYSVFLGTTPNLGPGDLLGATTNTSWTPSRLAPLVNYYWQVVASRPHASTTGPIWQFTTRGVDRFQWGVLPAEQVLGQPFPGTIRALADTGAIVTNYQETVALKAFNYLPVPTVQILTFTRYADVTQGGSYEKAFQAISDHFTAFKNTDLSDVEPAQLEAALADKHVFLVVEQIASAETMQALGQAWADVLRRFVNRGGLIIVSSYFWDEHEVLGDLLQATPKELRTLVDIVIRTPHILTEGLTLPIEVFEAKTFQPGLGTIILETVPDHQPVVLARDIGLGHVVLIGSDFYFAGSRFDRVLANAVAWAKQPGTPVPVLLEPEQSSAWTNGRLNEQFTLREPGESIRLMIEDETGHWGISTPMRVTVSDDLSLTLSTSLEIANVTTNLNYIVRVTNSGPAQATSVVLTNFNPGGLDMQVNTVSQGSCAPEGDRIVCQLGAIPGGSWADLVFRTTPPLAGAFLTNIVAVGRGEIDGYISNNVAQVITAVAAPTLSIADVDILEGSSGQTNAVFQIWLSSPSAQAVVVSYTTVAQTALPPADYLATEGVLTFPSGTTTQYVSVPVVADQVVESSEYFQLQVSTSNAFLIAPSAICIIDDDDNAQIASMPFQEDWETGTFRPFWKVSSTAKGRAQVTTQANPHGGSHHLTLDSIFSQARNQVTLALDLQGYSAVSLRFFARNLGDSPDSPPTAPFGNADFDGVAISDDGSLWYEAVGLRTLSSLNQEIVVNLDNALVGRPLQFASPFYIRFNQYSDFFSPFPLLDAGASVMNELNPEIAGIAIDDITISGWSAGLIPVRASLISEDCAPFNQAIDPGETVTVALVVRNTGARATTNLIGRLLASANVIGPSQPVAFGAILPGRSMTNSVSFTAVGTCGQNITLLLELNEGIDHVRTIDFQMQLGAELKRLAENFETVPIGNLPAGWTNGYETFASSWRVVSGVSDTPPRSVYVPDSVNANRVSLTSPRLFITSSAATVAFKHFFDTESCCDYASLSVAIEDGPFRDIETAGGEFLQGGYTSLFGWHGNSAGFVQTIVALPASFAQHFVQFRWVMDTDSSVGGNGWWVDTLVVADGVGCCTPDDLVLRVTDLPPTLAVAGQPYSYTLVVENNGPGDATGVVVTNYAPLEISATPSQGQGFAFSGGIVCELGTIRARTNASIHLSSAPRMADMLYTNLSVAVRAEPDPNTENNQVRVVIATAPPTLAMQAAAVSEGDAGLHSLPVQVQLSAPSRLPVTADYQTSPQTARAPGDFQRLLGVLTIPPGVTNRNIPVLIAGDATVEDDETMLVQFSNAGRLTLTTSNFLVSILNDDLQQVATMPFFEDWENGSFRPVWRVSGTAGGRAEITSANGPLEGLRHLLLDSDRPAVNEVTLQIDLAEYTNVVLRFLAKSLIDEPNAPPSPAFLNRANFDGVAISNNGTNWFEAIGLRNLTGGSNEVVVHLDAQLTRFGLTYNQNFFIRFNQFDDQLAPNDGIGIDDIALYGLTHGMLARLHWGSLPSVYYAGQPFPATLNASDAFEQPITAFQGPVTLSASGLIVTDAFLVESFEDGDSAGWEMGDGNYGVEVTSTTAATGNYSASLNGGVSRTHNGLRHSLPNIQPGRAKFAVRAASTSLAGGYVTLGNGSTFSDTAVFFFCRSDGFMAVVDQAGVNHTPLTKYQSNRWYNVEFSFHWAAKTFDFYVDSQLVEAGISFRNPAVPYLSRVDLFNFHPTRAWWDDIELLDAEQQVAAQIVPMQVNEFSNGTWTGQITIPEAWSKVWLFAADGAGHVVQSEPLAILSGPIISKVHAANGFVTLEWDAIPGWLYRVESSDQPGEGQWQEEPLPVQPDQWTGAINPDSRRFYRVVGQKGP